MFSRTRLSWTPSEGMKRNRHTAFSCGCPQDIPIPMIEWFHGSRNGKICTPQSKLCSPLQFLRSKLRVMIGNAGEPDKPCRLAFTKICHPLIVRLVYERY